jgi:hypothetical protein
MNLDENVKTMLRERAESVAAAPVVPERTVRRTQMRKMLSTGGALAVVAAIAVAGAFVVKSAFSSDAAPLQPAGTPDAAETTDETSGPQDIALSFEDFAPLQTGTYFIDPDRDPSTPLRVEYEIAADGWSGWMGAVKFIGSSKHVGVSIINVTNLASHGCRDHSPADPPIGPSVDDLATALEDLAPFRVTSPPTDVTLHGYRGKHLELTVPDLPVEHNGGFTECVDENLTTWFSSWDEVEGFFGHTGPGYTEEFWILDVEGTRLVIVATASPKVPAEAVAEMRAVIDSIQIKP